MAGLIDFETALAGWDGKAAKHRSRGDGRAVVMRGWLEGRKGTGLGARWVASMNLAGSLFALLMAVLGAVAAWGTLDRELGGIHVVWFLGATLVVPWVFLAVAALGWVFRKRVRRSGWLGLLIERVALKFAGKKARVAIERVRSSGELGRVTGWHVARLTQWAAAAFHGGAVAGLGAMVMFKRVGFFWETTTQAAMESLLGGLVKVMSAPWASIAPWAVPDVVASKRGPGWDGGGESWWPFLLISLLVWGVLPRGLMAVVATVKERRVLGGLTFQAPQHRKLWRALTEVRRGEEPSGPVDGALVLVMGSAEPDRDELRPYLLNRLRMNPTAWESLGVLDEGREEAARAALKKAPAGIVMLAEGWALSPRQMSRALEEVGGLAEGRRVVLLIGNAGSDGGLKAATDGERAEWERYVDGLKGSEVELVFYEEVAR